MNTNSKNTENIFRRSRAFFGNRKHRKVLLLAAAVLLVLFLLVRLVLPRLFFKQTFNGTDGEVENGSPDVWNIFLGGVDNDNIGGIDKLGNADGEVIVSINRSTRKVYLTSILRDTFLKFDDGRYGNKVTLIYHYYGLDSLLEAIETNFNVTLDNYVLINYPTLISIVDAVGGLEMSLYKEEVIELNAKVIQMNTQLLGLDRWDGIVYTDLDNFEGERTFTLTGKQVAGFARVRLSDSTQNDLGRTERERRLIMAVKDKFLSLSFSKKLEVCRTVLDAVQTDLPKDKIVSMLLSTLAFSGYDFVSQRIPLDDTYYGQDGYLYPDLEPNRAFLRSTIYNEG